MTKSEKEQKRNKSIQDTSFKTIDWEKRTLPKQKQICHNGQPTRVGFLQISKGKKLLVQELKFLDSMNSLSSKIMKGNVSSWISYQIGD